MLALIISAIIGILIGWGSYCEWGWGWAIACGMTMTLISQLLIGLLIRRKVSKVNEKIQGVMVEAQTKINRMVQGFQRRPLGSPKEMQKMLEKEQNESVRKALDVAREMEPWYKWNFLLEKQINTMRMMLHFQLREIEEVDKLLPKCLLMDVRAVAIKIVRMYKKGNHDFHKLFSKKSKRLKNDDAALLYGLYSWILVKEGQNDKALATLIEAKKKTSNETIVQNWEHLANGRVKQFSNAGLGDLWYSLYLEEPKVKTQKMRRSF
ncbi:MAG: hypothetical protein ACYC4Q_01505 [Victivallaceae bacterium]